MKQDGGEIDAITASTITSRAFLSGINGAYKAYMGNGNDAVSGATKVDHQVDLPAKDINDSIN